jgi:hypothetical protein
VGKVVLRLPEVLVQTKVAQPVPSETVVVLDIMQVQVVVVTTVVVLDMAAAAAAEVQVLQITKPQASLKLKGLNQEMVL